MKRRARTTEGRSRSVEKRRRRRWLPFVGGSLLVVATAAAAIVVLAARHPTAQLTPAGLPTLHPTASAVNASPSSSPPAPATPTPSPTPDPTQGWVSYHSTPNLMSFRHPPGWKVFECGWVYIAANLPVSGCPTDGAGGVILAGPGVTSNQSFGDISHNPSLYTHVRRTAVTVDGVPGTRISAYQTSFLGGGSTQVEYDLTTGGRRYTFLAYVKWPGYETGDITTQFDQLVSTVTFDR